MKSSPPSPLLEDAAVKSSSPSLLLEGVTVQSAIRSPLLVCFGESIIIDVAFLDRHSEIFSAIATSRRRRSEISIAITSSRRRHSAICNTVATEKSSSPTYFLNSRGEIFLTIASSRSPSKSREVGSGVGKSGVAWGSPEVGGGVGKSRGREWRGEV